MLLHALVCFMRTREQVEETVQDCDIGRDGMCTKRARMGPSLPR